MKSRDFFILLLICFAAGTPALRAEEKSPMTLTSSAFEEGEEIPEVYTCEGKGISPSMEWKNAPAGTRSFALIADDPDTPMGTWTHWVIYNLPPTIDFIPEDLPPIKKLANAEMQGTNGLGKIGYYGPCPPSGSHRYYFKFYALDNALELPLGASKEDVLKAMEGHVLAEAQLMGRYQKKQK